MTGEELEMDRYYENKLEETFEEETVLKADYDEIKELAEKRKCQLLDVLEYIRNNDCISAYEYLVSEGIENVSKKTMRRK